jgi:hypothetical protein
MRKRERRPLVFEAYETLCDQPVPPAWYNHRPSLRREEDIRMWSSNVTLLAYDVTNNFTLEVKAEELG